MKLAFSTPLNTITSISVAFMNVNEASPVCRTRYARRAEACCHPLFQYKLDGVLILANVPGNDGELVSPSRKAKTNATSPACQPAGRVIVAPLAETLPI